MEKIFWEVFAWICLNHVFEFILEKGKDGEIYNIGGNKSISVREALEYLINFSYKKIYIQQDKKLIRVKDINLQVPSSKKFRKHTSWKPKVSIKNSLWSTHFGLSWKVDQKVSH